MSRHRLMLLALPLCLAARAGAATLVSVSAVQNGAWINPAVWNLPSGYPDNLLDPDTQYDVTVQGFSLTLAGISPVVTNLTFRSGELSGNGAATSSLSVSGTATLPGAFLDAITLHLLSTATTNLSSTSSSGWTTSTARVVNDGLFNAGAMDISNAVFTNNGTLTLDSAATVNSPYGAVLGSKFTNNGLVLVRTGAAYIYPDLGNSVGGAYCVSAGALLNFEAPGLAATGSISGAGDVAFVPGGQYPSVSLLGSFNVTGKTTIDAGVDISVQASTGSLDIATALTGTGSMTVAGLTTWVTNSSSSGFDLVGGLFANGGISFLDKYGAAFVLGHALTSGGDATLGHAGDINPSTLELKSGAAFNNKGTLLIHVANIVSYSDTGTAPVFNNTGTLTIDSFAESSGIFNTATLGSLFPGDSSILFQNSGLVHVKNGTFQLAAVDGGSTGGQFQVDAGATLTLAGTQTFSAASTITGAGSVLFASGSANTIHGCFAITGNATVNAATAFNTDASMQSLATTADITGTGHLTVAGTYTWGGGNIKVASITAGASINFQFPSELYGSLINGSTATSSYISGGQFITLAAGASLINNGTLTLKNKQVINDAFTTGATPQFINHGTLNISASTSAATTNSFVAFINTGVVNITGGKITLVFQDPATTGEFHVATAGTLAFFHNYDFSSLGGPTLTGDGMVIVDAGATVTLPIDTAFTGTIEVDGTLLMAAARDPLNAHASPGFTIITSSVPEPASLALLAMAIPLLLRRR